MPLVIMFAMLAFVVIGFKILAAVILGIAPGVEFLFEDNHIALFIFTLSLFSKSFPFIICLPISLAAGLIFASPWYVTTLQYVTLEAMLALLSVVGTLMFGAGSTIYDTLKRK